MNPLVKTLLLWAALTVVAVFGAGSAYLVLTLAIDWWHQLLILVLLMTGYTLFYDWIEPK